MGIAQAGIAFRVSDPIEDLAAAVASVFGEDAAEMASPVADRFDTRNHSDVMVQSFGDVCFISNDDLAWPLLKNERADTGRLHSALGRPELLMAFCHHDDAGSHGYAVFNRGRRTRTRLQTDGLPDLPALAQSGTPLPFEHRWLSARPGLALEGAGPARRPVAYPGDSAVPPRALTGRMLQAGLDSLFGVCPWETLLTPTYRFFRLGSGEPEQAETTRAVAVRNEPAPRPAPRRGWWRFR
jgi:hypothetical protein